MNVYLDSAASSQLHPTVLEEMVHFLKEGTGNPSSTHSYGRSAKAAIESARKTIANHLHVSPMDIVFTSCGTESNNMAIKNCVHHYQVKHIITSPTEHKCVKETVNQLCNDITGVRLHYVKTDSNGLIDFAHLQNLLATLSGKKLVTLMHANNETGAILDIERVGALCEEHQTFFHTDTVQTIAHIPIDLSKLNVHYCAGSAHKFHGPKGVGFLYMRKDAKIPALIHGGGQERNYRSGTENIAGIVGMAKAFEIAVADMVSDNLYIDTLKSYAKKKLLEAIPDVQFIADEVPGLNRVLSVSLPERFNQDTLLFQLDMAGVAVSGGSACSSGASTGSYVMDVLGVNPKRKTIRISFSIFNSKEEIDYSVEQLQKIVAGVTI